jgi:8-hydroxy-5-deazaflavin:NADPH oxidoreductase
MTVGAFLVSLIERDSGFAALVPGMIVMGIGVGLFYSSVTTAGVTALGPSRSSLAGGLVYMFQVAGSAVGLGLTTTVFITASEDHLQKDLADADLRGGEVETLQGALAGTKSAAEILPPVLRANGRAAPRVRARRLCRGHAVVVPPRRRAGALRTGGVRAVRRRLAAPRATRAGGAWSGRSTGNNRVVNVTIIGTGNMARAIGRRLVAGGHQVSVLGKEVEAAEEAVTEIGADGSAKAGRSGDPIADDVVVLAVYYPDATAAVEQYGDQLAGKVVVDITNPVNETFDDLVTPPDSSAAQELAAKAGGARVVKAFNTTFANTLNEGEVAGEPLDVFLAADDEDAKATVAGLAEDGGLRAVDAGPLRRARELEAAGLLHMSVQGTLGTGFGSALKIVS